MVLNKISNQFDEVWVFLWLGKVKEHYLNSLRWRIFICYLLITLFFFVFLLNALVLKLIVLTPKRTVSVKRTGLKICKRFPLNDQYDLKNYCLCNYKTSTYNRNHRVHWYWQPLKIPRSKNTQLIKLMYWQLASCLMTKSFMVFCSGPHLVGLSTVAWLEI